MLVTLFGIRVFLYPDIKVLSLVLIIALHPFLESYTLLSSETSIEERLVHPQNKEIRYGLSQELEISMFLTFRGISIDVK